MPTNLGYDPATNMLRATSDGVLIATDGECGCCASEPCPCPPPSSVDVIVSGMTLPFGSGDPNGSCSLTQDGGNPCLWSGSYSVSLTIDGNPYTTISVTATSMSDENGVGWCVTAEIVGYALITLFIGCSFGPDNIQPCCLEDSFADNAATNDPYGPVGGQAVVTVSPPPDTCNCEGCCTEIYVQIDSVSIADVVLKEGRDCVWSGSGTLDGHAVTITLTRISDYWYLQFDDTDASQVTIYRAAASGTCPPETTYALYSGGELGLPSEVLICCGTTLCDEGEGTCADNCDVCCQEVTFDFGADGWLTFTNTGGAGDPCTWTLTDVSPGTYVDGGILICPNADGHALPGEDYKLTVGAGGGAETDVWFAKPTAAGCPPQTLSRWRQEGAYDTGLTLASVTLGMCA